MALSALRWTYLSALLLFLLASPACVNSLPFMAYYVSGTANSVNNSGLLSGPASSAVLFGSGYKGAMAVSQVTGNLYLASCNVAYNSPTVYAGAVFMLQPSGGSLVAGTWSTIAGNNILGSSAVDGVGTAASFLCPQKLLVDNNEVLYVMDMQTGTVRVITFTSGVYNVTTISGFTASSGWNNALAVTANGNTVYLADYSACSLKNATRSGSSWVVKTMISGGTCSRTDGTVASGGKLQYPSAMVAAPNGTLYILDQGTSYTNPSLRMLVPSAGGGFTLSTLAGPNTSPQSSSVQGTDGTGSVVMFTSVGHLVLSPLDPTVLYHAEFNGGGAFVLARCTESRYCTLALSSLPRRWRAGVRSISVNASGGVATVTTLYTAGQPLGLGIDANGQLYSLPVSSGSAFTYMLVRLGPPPPSPPPLPPRCVRLDAGVLIAA
jgi:hypothetical protein